MWLQTWKDGYVQQCAAPQVTLLGDTSVDLQLVSKVVGAVVDFEPLMDFPAAITFSDAAGRYLLCGVPDGRTVDILAWLGIQRVAWVSVPSGQSTGIDITLP